MIKGNQYWELLNISENNPEYELFKSLIEERTQIGGWNIQYYVKLLSDTLDPIYGEDPNAEFSEAYETKLIYEPTEEVDVLNSLGYSSDDVIQYMQIPKSMFKNNIEEEFLESYSEENELRPKPGDCIRTLWNNKLYEVIDVGSEQKIFQGKKFIWEFITRPYRHSEDSDSANAMLNDVPDEEFFPDINLTTTVDELSAYGDNEKIEDESNSISDIDTSYYGYDL